MPRSPLPASTWTPRAVATLVALAAACLLMGGRVGEAEPRIRYLGLDGGHARLLVDGREHRLAPGQRDPAGNEVVAAGPRSVWLRRAGRTFEIRAGGAGQTRLAGEVTLPVAADGRFHSGAHVNGRVVEVEVDPAAPAVLLTAALARAIGVSFDRADSVRVTHAGGDSLGFRALLGEVRLGAITVARLPAVVVDGHEPRRLLLGAPFIARLESANREARHLILRGRAGAR